MFKNVRERQRYLFSMSLVVHQLRKHDAKRGRTERA
jgi:hypothetical protein